MNIGCFGRTLASTFVAHLRWNLIPMIKMKTGYAAAFWRARTATYLEGIDQVAWKKGPAFSPSHKRGIPLSQLYFHNFGKHEFSKLEFPRLQPKISLFLSLSTYQWSLTFISLQVIESGENKSRDLSIKRLWNNDFLLRAKFSRENIDAKFIEKSEIINVRLCCNINCALQQSFSPSLSPVAINQNLPPVTGNLITHTWVPWYR